MTPTLATTPTAIAELVEDDSIYPRHAIDADNVRRIAEALQSGIQVPPVIADSKSKRIVDGWHRVRAYRRVHGDQAVIDVEFRSYRSELDIIKDAVALNSAHGRHLDRIDQVRAVLLLEKAGATPKVVATILHITTERVERLRVRVAEAPKSGEG